MNVSLSELLVVVLIALLVVRPEKMPEVARTVGRFTRSIRRLLLKVKDEMNDLIDPVEKTNERR